MKLIVAGSREINKYSIIAIAIQKSGFSPTEIVSGCARGVDSIGEEYARLNGLKCAQFPADWVKHGKSAGYKRNVQMAEYADALVAVWDGKSKGTMHMINIMKAKNKPFKVWNTAIGEYDEPELNG